MTVYPAMTSDQAAQIREDGRVASDADFAKGSGPSLDTRVVDLLVTELEDLKSLFPDFSRSRGERRWSELEAEAAKIVHKRFIGVDQQVLSDMDFWIWLATMRLSEFIDWRYSADGGRAAPANYGIKNRRENFIYRLWVQGDIGFNPETQDYALVNAAGRDVWRSHIFRQNYSNSRCLARALLRLQSGRLEGAAPLDKYGVREMAKLLRRLGSNVYFSTLSDSEADRLVLEHVEEAVRLGNDKRKSDAERRVQRRNGRDL